MPIGILVGLNFQDAEGDGRYYPQFTSAVSFCFPGVIRWHIFRCRFFFLLLLCLGIEVRADNVVTVSAVEGAPGSEVTVNVSLANTDAVSALQVLIPLDERLTYVAGSAALTDRCASHSDKEVDARLIAPTSVWDE